MKMEKCLIQIKDLSARIDTLEKHIDIMEKSANEMLLSNITTNRIHLNSTATVLTIGIDRRYAIDRAKNELEKKKDDLQKLQNIVDMAELALSGLEK